MRDNVSLWRATESIPRREQLQKNRNADVAVIGAGMAGVLTAHELTKQGLRTIVLEEKRIGRGQTENTTAKITSQHGMMYDTLIQKFGESKAEQYARANELAVRAFGALVRKANISCHFREAPAYLYSTEAAEPLQREAEAAKRLGIDACFTTETELPFALKGAVRFERQAQFHPLLFLRAIAEPLEIYENTRVLDVEDHRVVTQQGSVYADFIVFASHYPFVNVPGWYFWRMHQERAYALALRSEWLPRGMYLGVDADGLSFREADGLLLVCGGNHRTGENTLGGRYETLLARARRIVPVAEEEARWSAQDCITLDNVPYIGRYASSTPNWYVATGFGKWGMTSSMAAAMLISGLIRGREPDWAEVFSPDRFQLSAAAKNLATDTAQAFKGLAREWLALPKTALDELPNGHGGIVEAEGRKVGVYKDDRGECHLVHPRCPHLGCQVEWNPDERTWDCPCHGSRFRFTGELIDHPAQEGLL